MFPFARRGLRVLMYHKVALTGGDELTVNVAQLDRQMAWLRAQPWAPVTLADVARAAAGQSALPRQAVLVTFDDAYRDTLELALPILRRHGRRAAVFVPSAFLGTTSSWDRDARPLMTAGELRALAAEGWELALHSHRHLNYATTGAEDVAADVAANFSALRAAGVEPAPALAYPYGRRPRAAAHRVAVRRALSEGGVRLAFRIGNRVNPLPLRDVYEVNRLGVRGDRGFEAFQRKLRWGRLL